MERVVRVRIMENTYAILTDESEEYVEKIARHVDRQIRTILEENPRASITMATVLACFDFCDEANKAVDAADNLRGQIRDYLDELATARADYDDARKQLSKAEAENKRLREELGYLRLEQTPAPEEGARGNERPGEIERSGRNDRGN